MKNERQLESDLFDAVLCEDLPRVKQILARGVNPNCQTKTDGATPLMRAAHIDSVDFVSALVAGGADVNAKGVTGMTSLMAACSDGNLPVAKFLVEHGADVNAQLFFRTTALFYAVGSENENPELVGLLLEHGAQCNIRNTEGQSPLATPCASCLGLWHAHFAFLEPLED